MNNTKEQQTNKMPMGANRLLCAVFLFLKIVWRKYDTVEIEEGKCVTLRIGWSTAWSVSKGIWLSKNVTKHSKTIKNQNMERYFQITYLYNINSGVAFGSMSRISKDHISFDRIYKEVQAIHPSLDSLTIISLYEFKNKEDYDIFSNGIPR